MAKRIQVKTVDKPIKVTKKASAASAKVKVKPKVKEAPASTWTFLSNHAHVLLLIARDPEMRLREVADLVGITERAVQRIVADLEEGDYLERERLGRRNRYKVHPNLPLRHPVEAHRDVGALLELIIDP